MGKYIDGSGLSHFMGILKGYFVPNTRTVNGHALSSDVTVTKSDVGLGNVTNTKQAPEAHASTDITYGLGSDTKYGHVKLSDTPSTLGNSSGGVAATPKAVFDALTTVANGYLANTSKVDGVGFVSGSATRYVVCGTAAGTATKEIVLSTCKDYSVIPTGTVVYVEFTNTNTAAVANLAFQAKGPVSGSSGNSNIGSAAGIKYRGANLPSAGTLAANRIYTFVYDGTNWELIGDLDTTVSKTTTTPKMNGTAAVGSETKYAAGDHVHPSDTSRVPTSRTINGHALSSDVVLDGSDIMWEGADETIEEVVGRILGSYAFGKVKVGSTNVEADSLKDTLELVGSNVTLTPDATNDKVTIGITASNVTTALGNTAVNRATADGNGNNIINTYATKTELGTATAGALQYKGTVSQESTITGASYKKGWYYVVATAGTYVGKVCEVGDMLIAKQDKTSTPANDWDAVQSNIEVLSNSEIDTLWAAA